MENPLNETFAEIRRMWDELPPEMRERALRRLKTYPADWDFEDVKEYEDAA